MTPRDRERYSRQWRFPELGEEGQTRLLAAAAAVVGCGALGTVHANLLARAGVGRLFLIDRDYVEISNLQRQWLYSEEDAAAGVPKAVAAARELARANSGVRVEPIVADLNSRTIAELLEEADVVLDGTDNFEVRYLINDWAIDTGRPWIYGGAVGSYGVVMAVLPGDTPCLRCVYPDPPTGAQPTCETAGVLGPLTSIVGSLQAMEAIKLLAGKPEAVTRRLTRLDVWSGQIRQSALPERDPDCPACVHRELVHLAGQCEAPISLCGRNAVQIHERHRPLDLAALEKQLAPLGTVRANEFALRFHKPPYELTVFPDGRAIIKGTTEIGVARSLYAQYVGR